MPSENPAEFRTMFMFGTSDPHGWDTDFEQFTTALRRHEPDAFTHQWSGAFSGDTLSFAFTHSGGSAEGMVGTSPFSAAVEDCTAAEAAEFALWLLQEVVPAHVAVQFNIREGAEWELPALPLPRGDVADIVEALTSHVRSVLDYEESHTY